MMQFRPAPTRNTRTTTQSPHAPRPCDHFQGVFVKMLFYTALTVTSLAHIVLGTNLTQSYQRLPYNSVVILICFALQIRFLLHFRSNPTRTLQT